MHEAPIRMLAIKRRAAEQDLKFFRRAASHYIPRIITPVDTTPGFCTAI